MKQLFILLLLATLSSYSFCQDSSGYSITGSVADSANTKAIPFATITLFKQDKKIAATSTDSLGSFKLQNILQGDYRMEVSSVSYLSKSLPLAVISGQSIFDMGAITLALQKGTLGAVTVTATKALIEDKGDRMVYNAEKDPSNSGGTAADVLRKVPSITVDLDGNVQMRGNGNIKVLVNGKPSSMMARNLADALKQMPANVIKSVEVITSPGAKYDAEGAGGVINIITKKGLQGFNGSVNATIGNFNRSLGTNLNLKKKKIGFSLSANMYQYRNVNDGWLNRKSYEDGKLTGTLYQNSTADNTGTGGYGEMSFDYEIDSMSRVNMSMNVWGGNYPNNSTRTNRLTDAAGIEIQNFRNETRYHNPYGNGQIDLGYTKTFRKPQQEFSLLGQFSRMPDNYFYETDRYEVDKLAFRDKSSNYSRNKEYTIQADYVHPFVINGKKDTTNIKLEVGTKAIIRDIGSEYRVERSIDGHTPFEIDPSQSNDFEYNQRVSSVYSSFRLDTKKKWGLTIGARLEQTNIEGRFITNNTTIEDEYRNLIPNATISKGFNKHTIKISYTQRITRPLLWYLNPWLNQTDPKNIVTGNPDLNPELSHSTELVHSYNPGKGMNVNTSFYWRYVDNAIDYLSTIDKAGISTSRPENIARRQALGVNVNVSGSPVKNWTLNGQGDVRYIDLYSPALNQGNNGIMWNGNINSTVKLGKKYTVQANGGIGSGWISLQSTNTGWRWYGFTAKRTLMKEKATLSLNINNPFARGVAQTRVQTGPNFTSESGWLFVNRSVRLTFEWRFGQMSAGGKQGKKITNDDAGSR